MLLDRVDHLIDRVVEFAMRPRVLRLRRWSFVVTLPLAGLLIWLRGFQGLAILPAVYILALTAILLLARRIGGPRGELLLDFVMHPVGRRAFRTELHLLTTLARAVGRIAGRRAGPGEFPYHRGSSDLGVLLALAPAIAAELVAVELLLSGLPLWVRLAVAALSLYGFAWLTAWTVGLRVYPHRLRDGALQANLGAFYRATVPLDAIATLDVIPRRPTKRTELLLSDDTAAFAVGGRVNLRLRLASPVTVHRPLGDPVEVSELELAADHPAALVDAIHERLNAGKATTRTGERERTLARSHEYVPTPGMGLPRRGARCLTPAPTPPRCSS